MPLSVTKANSILGYLFGKVQLGAIENVYIGLSSNNPEEDNGTFTELSGGNYRRVFISQWNETYPNVMGAASNRSITNQAQITFNKATSDWLTAKGFGLFDAPEGGSPYYYAALDEPFPTTAAGAVALFDPQTLKISFLGTDVHEATAATTE